MMGTRKLLWGRQHGISAMAAAALCGLLWLAAAPLAPAQTNQMTNGSFEADPIPVFPGYTGTFTGWSASGGTLRNDNAGVQAFYHTGSNGPVPNGSQVAGCQGGGSFSQTLGGLANAMQCTPSFYVCKRADPGSNGNITLEVKIGTQTIYGPTVVSWTAFTLVNIPAFLYNSAWGNTLTFTVSNPVGDATLLLDQVVFNTIPTYTITPSVNGGNGTITPNTVQTVLQNGSSAFTMSPAAGYRVFDVLINGGRLATPVTSYTFNTVTANQTIAVSYALPDWTFNTNGYTEGWVSPVQIASGSVAGGSYSYNLSAGATDPTLSNTGLALPRASYSWVMVRARNQTTATAGRLYWGFGAGLSQARSVGYGITPNDTQVSEYWASLNAVGTDWTGGTTVTELRSDLPDGGLPATGTLIDWDQMKLSATGPPVPFVTAISRQNPAGAGVTNSGTLTWDVRFSHSMTTVAANDFVVTSTGTAAATVGSIVQLGPTWYRVSGNVAATGTGTLRLDSITGGSGRDVANQAITPGFAGGEIYSVDRDRPAVALSSVAGDPVNSAITVSVTLSESLATFNAGHITTSNATVSGFSGSGTAYSFTLTPSANGVFSAVVNTNQFADAVGNNNTASNSLSRTFDNVAPFVTLSTAAGALVNGGIAVTGTVSEPGTSFALGDLVPSNATIQNFSLVGQSISFDLQPQSDGAFSVSVPATQFQDAAGNDNTASNSVGSTFDGTAPGVTLSTTAAATVNGGISMDVSITESVSTFVSADITPTNATVSNFSGSGDTYSFTLAPLTDGNFSAIVNGAAFADAAGNNNTASNAVSRLFDGTAPFVSTRVPGSGATVASLPSVTLTFSEPVSNVSADDLTVGGSAATGVSGSGAGPYMFTGFTAPGNGNVNVNLLALDIEDAVGNLVTANGWSYTVNNAAPSVTLTSSDVNDGAFSNQAGALAFQAVFSEPVSGFAGGDIQVTNGATGGFSGSGATYSFTVTPASEGAVTISIPAASGNAVAPPNNATSASTVFSFTYDATAPVITLNGGDVLKDCGAPYTDLGIDTAVDNFDGDVSAFVNIGGDAVSEFSAPIGSPFTITYSVTDTAGNLGTAQRLVTVTDNCPLAVGLNGDAAITANYGDAVSLSVSASGNVGALHYDWQQDDGAKTFVTLNAPDAPSLLIDDAAPGDEGEYQCVVSDAVTVVTSPAFTLTLEGNPLPVGGGLVLALSTLVLAAVGARTARRKR